MGSLSSYIAFCVAAFALAVVPGPTVTVIIANSLRYGTRAGLLNVAGTVAAGLIWVTIAALGLTAAIQMMGVWFDLLRYAGAAYLVWLGYKLLRSKGDLGSVDAVPRSDRNFFTQALFVTLTNPKVLVLFGMMIPPFMSRDSDPTLQVTLLGATFVAIASATDTAYALLAGSAGTWLSRSRIRALEVVSGLLLAGGGIWMVLRGR
ncbi:MAG: LysE family translocator [Proteobacteria bacterium]|nr:LysE family translocator [Pseudomonadota bacterium]